MADNSGKKIYTRIQVRHDKEYNWRIHGDVVPLEGEICIEYDTGKGKVGDGLTSYKELPYSIFPYKARNLIKDIKYDKDSVGNTVVTIYTEDPNYYYSFTVLRGEKGNTGEQGVAGSNGHTPDITIGDDGDWYIDGTTTGKSSQGKQGSAWVLQKIYYLTTSTPDAPTCDKVQEQFGTSTESKEIENHDSFSFADTITEDSGIVWKSEPENMAADTDNTYYNWMIEIYFMNEYDNNNAVTGVLSKTVGPHLCGSVAKTGAQGVQGIKGDVGEQGPQGKQGEKGEQGSQGPTGLTGPTGPKGDTGDVGPQGPKGDTGDTGPQGPKGDKGPKGDTGATGEPGYSGVSYPGVSVSSKNGIGMYHIGGSSTYVDDTYNALLVTPGSWRAFAEALQNAGSTYLTDSTLSILRAIIENAPDSYVDSSLRITFGNVRLYLGYAKKNKKDGASTDAYESATYSYAIPLSCERPEQNLAALANRFAKEGLSELADFINNSLRSNSMVINSLSSHGEDDIVGGQYWLLFLGVSSTGPYLVKNWFNHDTQSYTDVDGTAYELHYNESVALGLDNRSILMKTSTIKGNIIL